MPIEGWLRPTSICPRMILIRSSGKVSARPVDLNRKGNATILVPLGRADVERVFIALVNSSESRNNLKFLIKATLA